ncbi:MAG: PIN domain-containing protein [Halococcoides sp.]
MTVLDSSTIIDMLQGVDHAVEYLDGREPFSTSTICVYEVIDGKIGAGSTDIDAVRTQFGGIHSVAVTEEIVLDAVRLQDQVMSTGDRLSHRDAIVAATAQTIDEEFVVADAAFETDVLESELQVTNLRARE